MTKSKDAKMKEMDIILDQYAKDDAERAASSENNESILRIQRLCDQQASQLEHMSKSYADAKQYNDHLLAQSESLKSFQDANRSIDLGKVQAMKDERERQSKIWESRIRLMGIERRRDMEILDEKSCWWENMMNPKSAFLVNLVVAKFK